MGPTNGELEKVCKQLNVMRGHAHGILLAAWVLHCAQLAAEVDVEVGTLLELSDTPPNPPTFKLWDQMWSTEKHSEGCDGDRVGADTCWVCEREKVIVTASQLLDALPERGHDATP